MRLEYWPIGLEFYHLKCAYNLKVTVACRILHSLLRIRSASTYTPSGYTDEVTNDGTVVRGAWRNEYHSTNVQPLPVSSSRYASVEAEDI